MASRIAGLVQQMDGAADESMDARAELIHIGHPAISVIIDGLPSLGSLGQLTAIEVFEEIRDPRCGPALIELLTSDNSTVREWAALALADLGIRDAVEPLWRAYRACVERATPADWSEPVGLRTRWTDLNWKDGGLSVATQLVQDGWEVIEGDPKTNSGIRTIALDTESVEVLRTHQRQQKQAKLSWGAAWLETGRIFTQENGEWLHPGKTSDLFDRLVVLSGLPPIRLHDLRHGAATLALAAGVDIKIVSEMLGHSDTQITRDIYQAVLDDLARAAAEAVVQLVPRARTRARGLPSGSPQPLAESGTGTA